MKQKIKISTILIILLIASTAIAMAITPQTGGSNSTAAKNEIYSPSSTAIPPLQYTRMCCIQDIYWVDWRTGEDYLQVPISVEIWDKNLNPIRNIKVHVQVFNESLVSLKFDQVKYTDNNGMVKFGYSEIYPYGPNGLINPNWDSNPRIIKLWIVDNNGYGTYMEKKFEIKAD